MTTDDRYEPSEPAQLGELMDAADAKWPTALPPELRLTMLVTAPDDDGKVTEADWFDQLPELLRVVKESTGELTSYESNDTRLLGGLVSAYLELAMKVVSSASWRDRKFYAFDRRIFKQDLKDLVEWRFR